MTSILVGWCFMLLFISLEWVHSNLFYVLSLLFVYFTYAYLLKEIIWKRTWPHLFYYFCAFSIVGASFNYFLEPNYVKVIYKIFTNQFSSDEIPNLVITSFFWIGWSILFSQTEKFFAEKLGRDEQPILIENYIFIFFAYILFLNSLTIILNKAFGRPI